MSGDPLALRPSPGRWVALCLLAAGLVGWAIVIYLVVQQRQDYADAQVADGIVTKLNAGGSHPEIEFTTARGETVAYPQGGVISGYTPNQHVRVLYHPADPKDDPTLDVIGAKYASACFLAPVATIALAAGLVLLLLLGPALSPDRIQRRLRWTEAGGRAQLRPQLVRGVLAYCVATVVAGQALVFGSLSDWMIGSAVFAVAWGTYVLFIRKTQIAFVGQTLVVDGGLLARRVVVNMQDILSFAAQPTSEGSHTVVLLPRSGAPVELPISLEPIQVKGRGMPTHMFPAPLAHAEWVASRMVLMLDRARHAAG